MLSAKEIATVNDYLLDRGISYEPLRIDLIDHLCCSIELEMVNGTAFKTALHSAAQQFGEMGLETTQEATLYFLTQNLKKMKLATTITGLVGSIFVLIGILFKTMHWPGANEGFILGSIIMGVVYLPLLLSVKIKEGKTINHKMGVVSGILAVIIFLFGTTFKVMHWPGATILINLSIGVCCLVFLPLHLVKAYQQTENKWFNSTIVVSIFTGVLALYAITNRTESYKLQMAKKTHLTTIQKSNQNLVFSELTSNQANALQAINKYEAQLLTGNSTASIDLNSIDFDHVNWLQGIHDLQNKSQKEFDYLLSIAVNNQMNPEHLSAIHQLPLYDRIVALEYLKVQLF
jgi:hypothetical protein